LGHQREHGNLRAGWRATARCQSEFRQAEVFLNAAQKISPLGDGKCMSYNCHVNRLEPQSWKTSSSEICSHYIKAEPAKGCISGADQIA
jgi:hypothetical protein